MELSRKAGANLGRVPELAFEEGLSTRDKVRVERAWEEVMLDIRCVHDLDSDWHSWPEGGKEVI